LYYYYYYYEVKIDRRGYHTPPERCGVAYIHCRACGKSDSLGGFYCSLGADTLGGRTVVEGKDGVSKRRVTRMLLCPSCCY